MPGCSLIAILDLKGKVSGLPVLSPFLCCFARHSISQLILPHSSFIQSLIQRSYRDDIPTSAIEKFLPLVLEQEEEGQFVTPCFTSQGINYLHIRHNNLYRSFDPVISNREI